MGGVGSGNWHRFDKKTMADRTHNVDVRYLHRDELLKAGGGFSLRWSRGEHETGSIGGSVEGHLRLRPERVILHYRCRSGQGTDWEDVWEPVSLEWTACNFGGERPWFVCPGAGCGRRVAILYGEENVWRGEVFPVPTLLRSSLREPAGEQDNLCPPPCADDKGKAWR